MKKALLFIAATLMLVCSCKTGGEKTDGGATGAGEAKVSGNFNVEGDYYIKYANPNNSYTVVAQKGKFMRMDLVSVDDTWDDAGNPIKEERHYAWLSNAEGQFEYNSYEEVWEQKDYGPKNTIFNTTSELKIANDKYTSCGFVKEGNVKVMGHNLDLFVGTGDMNKTWAGYEMLMGSSGDYKMTFATYGGILFYLTRDEEVHYEAVAASTKVPDAAFEKSLDLSWVK